MERRKGLAFVVALALLMTSCAQLGIGGPSLKIGMVTDIGQLEDKSFNEYSW
jgi:basic membrane lipoprotein Med (substrate-binding protein (PBP1-ABC) superfamily)